ncbi:hypothetical protein [Brevibacillus centrosporus]|jgi:hypothetical protein|uniref:hypothetical protein n=1 Tax=Brevibacillus centrosporus TaxID=54910 RepID=UPI003B01D420
MAMEQNGNRWTLAGTRWGDWRHWKKYQPTILYLLLLNVHYYYITYHHRLWYLHPQWPLNSELICVLGELIVFTSTVLIFLGRYPEGKLFSLRWTGQWVCVHTLNEWLLCLTGTFRYNFFLTHLNSIPIR